ncbi:predicted NBD/HSP70 family sugar kinase [Ureibacillus xyleni]|uniref:Predicted NBD/HSP70 family sugar kinase n=1 Tax=Ureibacillus xyleni TaxID=614648 RepID=A0A285RX00_9BACL|nr:ROK family protein [Ureibacillus xyleni]SOB98821.1 predicted NBD/HSP70 family sugar kinase [Ureibacillus xyleni]
MKKNIIKEQLNKSDEYFAVYDFLQRIESASKMEIMHELNIKKTTLVRILDSLEEAKLVYQSGKKLNGIGRPSITYKVNKHFGYLIGVHITRMRVMVTLLDLKFEEINSKISYMTSFHSPSFIISFIQNSIDELLVENQLSKDDIFSIGIAAVGSLNKKEGLIYQSQSFIQGGELNFRIVDEMKSYFNGTIILDKGVNASITAEHYFAHKRSNNLLLIVSGGWGLDCGIIKDNQLLTTNLEDGKAIEHMVINFEGKPCRCGKNGCLITFTSFEYILNKIKAELPTYESINTKEITNATVTEAVNFLKSLNKSATEIIMNTAKPLAIGAINLSNIFKVDRIIINGPLFEHFPNYFDLVTSYFESIKGDIETTIDNGELGDYASVKGAGIMSFQAFIHSSDSESMD